MARAGVTFTVHNRTATDNIANSTVIANRIMHSLRSESAKFKLSTAPDSL